MKICRSFSSVVDQLRNVPLLKPIPCIEVAGVRLVVRLRDEGGGGVRQLKPVDVLEEFQVQEFRKSGSLVRILKSYND